jgi:predicted membrane channel-forming protein YqfA (hemolysin III family)
MDVALFIVKSIGPPLSLQTIITNAMSLKKKLLYPVENWMRPVMLAFVSMPLLLVGMLANIEMLSAVGGLFFLTALALLFLSFLYHLFTGQWKKAVYILIFIAAFATIIGLLN